jgi:Ribonuclease G/E
VIVQVIRDPFGEKGPSVSMEVSLPGRFLVLTPLTDQGRRLEEDHQPAAARRSCAR